MCGIYGMVSPSGRLTRPDLAEAMSAAVRHRGPDARGARCSDSAVIGCERLRIVDPDPRADQPFTAESGERWLVCNGEIYNASDLRKRFDDFPFRSRSDVEPLVPLMMRHGPSELAAANGMFALAYWDATRRELTLSRDSAGEKPLFYLETRGEIWFASEIQALLVHPRLDGQIDEDAVDEYLAYGYVREPLTPFKDIRKVPAGVSVTFTGDGAGRAASHHIRAASVSANRRHRVSALRGHLQTAVARQLTADVPVGVFTSGGLDSSLITAIAARQRTTERLSTFSARFVDAGYDESRYARMVAAHTGTQHVEVPIDDEGLRVALDAVVVGVAEPIADPAILPTYILAREARRTVGVVLSGEGADELFGGYPTYLGHCLAARSARLPRSLRHGIERLTRQAAASPGRVPLGYLVNRFAAHASLAFLPRHFSWFGTGLLSYFAADRRDRVLARLDVPDVDDPVTAARWLDYATYLRDGLLVKLDRSTMLHGLESRAPFLDREVTAFARAITERDAVAGWRTKALLKAAAQGLVPRRLIHRRKRGLSVPIAAWLRGPLRAEVDRLLAPDRLERTGLYRELPIRQLWTAHRNGLANHARPLWAVIMLEYWMDQRTAGEQG